VKWFDSEKELWVMIVTGAKSSRAFCAGADLKEWLELYIPSGLPIPHFNFSIFASSTKYIPDC
jgi:enoyl-CoA hydratase/carnithine racemase